MGCLNVLPKPLRQLAHSLPQPVRHSAWEILHFFATVPYWGMSRYCPICERHSRKFGSFGVVAREDAMCMFCGSLERHRLVWIYFQRMTDLFDGRRKKVLHVAPELALSKRMKKQLGAEYITADLYDTSVMVTMDITDIQYPDNTFDVIYCSHVLEHVSDDRRAMREFYRTLKADGWAILLVPIYAEVTFEDPSIVDPAMRLAVYRQEDHVRIYGRDYIDRLKESGFKVKVTLSSELLSSQELQTMGIEPMDEIYYCTKN